VLYGVAGEKMGQNNSADGLLVPLAALLAAEAVVYPVLLLALYKMEEEERGVS
jgi:hypothetical protein